MVAGGTAVDGMAVGSTLLPLSFGAPPQHMHMHMHMRMHMHMSHVTGGALPWRLPCGGAALRAARARDAGTHTVHTLVYVYVNVCQPSTCLSDKYFIYLSFHPHRYDACPYHNMHAPTKRPQPINMHRNLYTGHIT